MRDDIFQGASEYCNPVTCAAKFLATCKAYFCYNGIFHNDCQVELRGYVTKCRGEMCG